MMKNNMQNKSKLSLKAYLGIGATAIVIVGLVATIVYLLAQKDNEVDKKVHRPTVATEDNINEVVKAMDEPVPDGSYEITMNTKWKFNGNDSDAYVANSTNNTRTVYFDVTLADTGDLVYSSPFIPVGKQIQGFTLDEKLDPGMYDGIVTYHLVDDDEEEVSHLSVTVTFQIN